MKREAEQNTTEEKGQILERGGFVWLTCNEDGAADGGAVCNMLWISVIQDSISGLQTFTLHIQSR